MNATGQDEKTSAIVRAVACAVFSVIALGFFGFLTSPFGYALSAIFGVFGAAFTANTMALRIFEQGKLTDIGLRWTLASKRNLGLGIAAGLGAATVTTGLPVLFGVASFQSQPDPNVVWFTPIYISVVLLFGAFGEEILFRGYAFQILLPAIGPWATIVPIGLLFALAHNNNPGATQLAIANTVGWGLLLGFAVVRSGDLWLATGLHYGWNVALPLYGVSVSGLTMKVTDYKLVWSIADLWSGGAYGPEGGLICTAVLVILAVFLLRAPIGRQQLLLRAPLPRPADPA